MDRRLMLIGCLVLLCMLLASVKSAEEPLDLLIVTVATDETDGYKRFKHSTDFFDLKVVVLGMQKEWTGGDIRVTVGGGMKVNLIKDALESYKDNKNLVIFFTDSYDVVFMGGKEEILTKFKKFNSKLVFSAEGTIWPDATLKNKYPEVIFGKRFLCSGGIIGYAPQFWSAFHQWDIRDTDDDQLYFTKLYLNTTIRNQLNMSLDHTSELVQNINFARSELELTEQGDMSRVQNAKYLTMPTVLHGNGPSKIHLNYFSNYVPDGWHSDFGCRKCAENLLDLSKMKEDNYPLVQVAMFVEGSVPFFEEFLEKFNKLHYPKSKIILFVHNVEEVCERPLAKYMLHHRSDYRAVNIIAPHDSISEAEARKLAIVQCLEEKCDYQFSINAEVQLTNPEVLRFLIGKNKKVVAPLVRRYGKLWSNFWGALNIDGYYARSEDYTAIVNREKRGIWNIPFMNNVYLTKAEVLQHLVEQYPDSPFIYGNLDPDMAFCAHLRNEGIFIYVTNEEEFGRLLFSELKPESTVHPDMWQMKANTKDWEEKYIHPGFWNATMPGTEVTQPCPDVYMFPLFTNKMADSIVELMEASDKWSTGTNEDERLSGGYENVPTIDTHMNQVGYEKQWLHILATYPTKILNKVYPGYDTGARSSMMFVVRYKPTEQPFLRPHHDSSTWTMNVALNSHGVNYEGGGCRFIRYNCSVTSIPKGHALLHPGRLTHYHEGLPTTKGTRYIAVSFVDP